MSLPAYPAYRESGVAWLGQVPAHWEVMPLKQAARLSTDRAADRSFPVGLEHIESWTGRFIEAETEFEGDGVAFRPGDILFGKLRPYLAKAWLADRPGEAVGDFHVIRSLPPHVPEFLQRVLLSREAISLIDGSTYGSKMPRASWEFIGSLAMPFPPPAEQRAIAAFLDRECGKIDALVAEQERLIALLKEKRQAVISHAVTKGLDPSAPMKDSGVPWLGRVPAHWEVRKLVTGLREPPCYGVLVPDFDESGVPLLRINDIKNGAASRETLITITPALSAQYARTIVKSGDIALSVVGTIGEVVTIDASLEGVNLSRALARLQPSDDLSADFLRLLFQSDAFQHFVDLTCVGTAQRVLNMSALSAFQLAFPPPAEQAAVSARLEERIHTLGLLITESERAIALLKERRAALISGAVTGKIDVRTLVPAEEAAAA